ncbi:MULTISPECIES: hypothetical protein [Acidiplasma]|uniref:hypothetical protein n=1 Tax=Acidiplasma TaxID=507753 RepID=UPI0012E27A88|nr:MULTISPECIES: hypothetical protein [Acidiplasma]
MPLIIDMPLSSFLSEAFAGLVALVIVTIVLYYVASKNISSDVFIYGFAISLIAYIVYMIWLGFISRSSGRTYIMDQHH